MKQINNTFISEEDNNLNLDSFKGLLPSFFYCEKSNKRILKKWTQNC